MFDLYYRNPRLLILTMGLILVSGLSSYMILPRMEDPVLTERVANINTIFPGADAERVETLVTEKLEEHLREVEQIKEIRSSSRAGISTITIELRDDVYEVEAPWSRIRDKLADAQPELPSAAFDPEFEQLDVRAYALIVGLKWNQLQPPNYAVLRRLAEDLKDELKAMRGTEEVDLFGDPTEEITVEIAPERLASLGLTADDVARQIRASDAKVSAGQVRSQHSDLLMEVDGELTTIASIERIPIQYGSQGSFVQLSEIAEVRKGIREPASSIAVVDGQRAITLGALVRNDHRVDHWANSAQVLLGEFRGGLPRGVELETVFEQNDYVGDRLFNLLKNLLLGGLAVSVVILFLMGWRSAIVVVSALPLSSLMVLAGMRWLGIPIHQMSVAGLIIALGLLIDNAIVMVDEVTERTRDGNPPGQAVASSVRHLMVPLLGSTLTTAMAFGPIALMPGPAGEFVGAIAISVILAIISSFFLAMTVIPALTAAVAKISTRLDSEVTNRQSWLRSGYSNALLASAYQRSLRFVLSRPALGVALGLLLPVVGFIQARHLPEQFFPPGDRDQIYVELELGPQASVAETVDAASIARDYLHEHPAVSKVHWFVGESAPTFYYNVVPRRKNVSRYAQALVQLKDASRNVQTIHELQAELDKKMPRIRTLVRQLEQGPPFDAPVEVRLYGPDLGELRRIGEELRVVMTQIPHVLHTRAELSEALPKLGIEVDEQQSRLAGLNHEAIARQLEATLEGAVGGSVLESTEELPIRVRVPAAGRASLSNIGSLDLLPAQAATASDNYRGVPLSSLAKFTLHPEVTAVPRFNGRRMNEIQAFIDAGVLPEVVRSAFEQELERRNFELPPGYRFEYGGEAAKRDEAIGNLMANVSVLGVLMVATLVLSFGSFRMAGIVGIVGGMAVGLGLGALWVFGYPFGFMAIVGTMGLVGVAINDAIVVLAAIRENSAAKEGNEQAVEEVVMRSTRHVVATSLTTMAGFAPLVIDGGGFWPPMAIAIAGGVGGATILALYFVPSAYLAAMCRDREKCLGMKALQRISHASGQRPKHREVVSAGSY